jgi:hypothetical protein
MSQSKVSRIWELLGSISDNFLNSSFGGVIELYDNSIVFFLLIARSVAVDKFNYKLLYPTLFGGVTAFHLDDFVRTNGFPNVYWGWGNEDDDMYLRIIKRLKKTITRYPIEIARYKMIRTHGHVSSARNPYRDKILHSKYDYSLDGLNTIRYDLHHVTLNRLFTLINVTLFQESYEQIYTRLNIKQKKEKT